MKKLIIFGATEMAKYVSYFFQKEAKYLIKAYCVEDNYKTKNIFNNKPLYSLSELENSISTDDLNFFIAIGPTQMNKIREAVYNRLKDFQYKFVNYIHPTAICDSEIGENNFIGANSIINPDVKIGNNNIIYEQCLISTRAIIENHCYIAPKAYVGSESIISNNSIIGINATIKNNVQVASESFIGACSYISMNTKHKSVYGVKQSEFLGCISDKINISMI